MATFNVTITDAKQLAGITAARQAYNAALTPETDEDGVPKPITSHPDYKTADGDYVQFVMASAAASYAKQYDT